MALATVTINLSDVLGRKILEETILKQNKSSIDISAQQVGIYFLEFTYSNHISRIKVIKN